MIYKITFLLLALTLSVSVASCKSVEIPKQHTIGIDLATERNQDSLAFELCQIYGLDQGIRLSEGFPNKMNLVTVVDTFNFDRVISFIERNGFPTKRLLGEKNSKNECVKGAAVAVLLHNPHRLVNEKKYFDILLNEVKIDNLPPDFFATILDKYYWINSKNKETRRVFYGSQFGKPCIQTKEATNKARIEIGLAALEDDGFVDCGDEVLDMPKERK
jgi:hypothetical protein